MFELYKKVIVHQDQDHGIKISRVYIIVPTTISGQSVNRDFMIEESK